MVTGILPFTAFLVAMAMSDAVPRPDAPPTLDMHLEEGSRTYVGETAKVVCEARGFQDRVQVTWERQLDHSATPETITPVKYGTTWHPPAKYVLQTNSSNLRQQINTLKIMHIQYEDEATYACAVNSNGNTVKSNFLKIEVTGPPVIRPVREIQNGLLGYPIELRVQVHARPRCSGVDWFGPDAVKINTTSSANGRYSIETVKDIHGSTVLYVYNFTEDDVGSYRAVVTNPEGTDEVTIELQDNEFVSIVSATSVFSLWGPAGLWCKAGNFPRPENVRITWYFSRDGETWVNLSQQSRHSNSTVSITSNVPDGRTPMSQLSISRVSYDNIGIIVCMAEDPNGTYRDSIHLNVTGPPVIEVINSTLHVGLRKNVELACIVTSNPPPTSVHWIFGSQILNNDITGAKALTGLTNTISKAVYISSMADYGSYDCQVTNAIAVRSQTIRVRPVPLNSKCDILDCPNHMVCDMFLEICSCPSGLTQTVDGDCVGTAPVSQDATDSYLWVGIGAGSVIILVLVAGILLYVVWRKRKSPSGLLQAKASEAAHINAAYAHMQYSRGNVYDNLTVPNDEFPRERLRFHEPLGMGKFGRVIKADALSINRTGRWEEVAVKMCQESATDLDKEDLYNEVVIIRKIPRHINVVAFYGTCTFGEPLLLIMEYVPGGDLRNYLRRKRPDYEKPCDSLTSEFESPLRAETGLEEGADLTAKDLLSFAVQSARGMQHLAANSIVHRDVAARNVLIGYKNVCKISDFGLARDVEGVDVYERTSKGPLPIRWMAPESLMEGHHSHKSDVWSFGILLWEIVTLGASPYSKLPLREVIEAVAAGKKLQKPEHCMDDLYSLMGRCWEHAPADRPLFSDLCKHLEWLLEKEADYIQLDQFQETVYMVLEEPESLEERL